ncbi:hypothetical protein F5Y10DRAFT_236401, partial [Nemania abortiva]
MSRRMDRDAAQRIGRARGPDDDFAKRAFMTAENESDKKAEEQQGSSENKDEEKKEDDKETKDN